MTKIIGINGSPRLNKNSAQLLDAALKGAKDGGAEVKRYDLAKLNFTGCTSCFECKRLGGKSFGRCAPKDDLKPVLDEILESEGLIVASPIYFGDVTGMTRNFFERLWFPGYAYSDEIFPYTKPVPVRLIFDMNVPDSKVYSDVFEKYRSICNNLLGLTEYFAVAYTMQFDDYSKYSSAIFDAEDRKFRHDKGFPKELEHAEDMGRSLAALYE